jgi:hypothetical protein
VAGGVTALIVQSEQDDDEDAEDTSFSGTFVRETLLEPGVTQTVEFDLTQTDQTVQGRRTDTVVAEGCCTAVGTGAVNGTIEGNTALLTVVRGAGRCSCSAKQSPSVSSPSSSAVDQAAQVETDGGDGRITGVYWDEEVSSGTATLENDGNILRYGSEEYLRQ